MKFERGKIDNISPAIATFVLTLVLNTEVSAGTGSIPFSSVTRYLNSFPQGPSVVGVVQYRDNIPSVVPADGVAVNQSGDSGSASLTITPLLVPFPSLTSTAVVSIGPNFTYASAGVTEGAALNYYFKIGGPSGNVSVNAAVAGFIRMTGSRVGDYVEVGDAFVIIDNTVNGFRVFGEGITAVSADGPSKTFSDITELTLQTDTLYKVRIINDLNFAKCQNCVQYGNTSGAYTGSMTVSVDPIFTIEGPNSSQYKINFSSGIGNGPVPEPSTWAMMLLGIGGIGAGLRLVRRKRDLALMAACPNRPS